MATIQPTVSYPLDGITKLFWETLTECDTAAPFLVRGASGVIGSIHAIGTWGGATLTLGASNDETQTFVDINDTSGSAISMTADSLADFSTAALWVAPKFSGGTSQDLDVTITLRSEPV